MCTIAGDLDASYIEPVCIQSKYYCVVRLSLVGASKKFNLDVSFVYTYKSEHTNLGELDQCVCIRTVD